MPSLFDDIYKYLEDKGIDAYAYLNSPENKEQSKTAFGKTPLETLIDLGGTTANIMYNARPEQLVRKAWEATGLEPTYGKTAFGGTSIPVGLRSKNEEPLNQPLITPTPVLPATTPNSPTPYGVSGMESQMVGEDPNKMFKQGETLEQYKARLGIDKRGETPEEVEKAWKNSPSMLNQVTNKQMFPREESPLAKEKGNEEAEEAKFAEQLGRFMGYAKQQIAKHYGIDVDSFDPEREALGNTYRQLMGLRYTTQQYNDVYNKNLTAAINKQKQAMTVMNGLVDDFRVHMGSEKDRKSLAAQRMEESKRRYEENKAAKEEKDKSAAKEKTGDIRKMLDAHYYQYTTPDADGKRPSVSDTLATLNDDYRAEYQQAQEEAERLMRDEKLTPAQAVRKALSKKENKVSTSRIETARNFLAPYKNKETSDPERYQARVDRLKEYGFSDAEIRKAKEGGVQNNAGGTQAKSKYVIKSVK